MFRQKALIWELESSGGSTSFIIGTMHVRSQSAFKMIEPMKHCILSKPIYYGESHIAELQAMSSIDLYTLPGNNALSEMVGSKQFNKWIFVANRHFQIDLGLFDRYIPFYVINMLQSVYLSQDYPTSLDATLWQYADAQNRQLGGVESADRQLQIMRSIPLDYQLKQLKDFMANPNSYKKIVTKLSKYYETQDVYPIYIATRKRLGKLRKLMLVQRNIEMSQTIVKLAEQPSTFSIGAAHLCGNKGVLTLLKRKGYKIKPFKMD